MALWMDPQGCVCVEKSSEGDGALTLGWVMEGGRVDQDLSVAA